MFLPDNLVQLLLVLYFQLWQFRLHLSVEHLLVQAFSRRLVWRGAESHQILLHHLRWALLLNHRGVDQLHQHLLEHLHEPVGC